MPKEQAPDSNDEPAPKISAKNIHGLKYFRVLRPFLKRLHAVGTARDTAGNRQLHMDQYCTLVLLWFYSPIVDSLRGLQQVSQLKKIQQRLKIPRTSLGSLSESVKLFDPEPLKKIARELADQLPDAPAPERFRGLGKTLVAVDGSVIPILARVARLAWITNCSEKPTCGYRLHTHFEILRGLPKRIEATSANPKGDADERKVLERTIEPDHCYVIDRGYMTFRLWNKIHDAGSSYVCRVRDRLAYETIEERPLTLEAIAAGVQADQVIQLRHKKTRTNHTLRLISVRCSAHTSRGRRRGRKFSSTAPSSDGTLRIATDLLDVPAELIAEMYQLRWTIELFFRMFKHLLGCRHLLSTRQQGVEIQIYSALIACLLILLYTGRMPTKRTFELLCFYLIGWVDFDEIQGHIDKLKTASS